MDIAINRCKSIDELYSSIKKRVDESVLSSNGKIQLLINISESIKRQDNKKPSIEGKLNVLSSRLKQNQSEPSKTKMDIRV